MTEDNGDSVRFKAQIWGLALGLPLFVLFAFIDDIPGDKVVLMTVYATFAGIFYVHRREICRRLFLVPSIAMLAIEFPTVFLAKIPQIHTGYVAALPVVLINYALVEMVLRGVKALFPVPDAPSEIP